MIHTLRPDVVVLDYALRANSEPGLRTGWDLAARITEDVETHNMPLIFVTGFSAEVQHRLETWADSRRIEVLPKPLGGGELVAAIERALGGPQAMPRLLKVLLADDDPSVATLVQRFLPADRYELETVQDGEACLRRLRAPDAGVDIVLLDLMMPVMSGYDVLRVMAFGVVGAGIPVLVLTNVPEPATANEMQLLRLDSVVTVLAKAEVLTRPSALGEQLDSVARRRLGAWGAPQVQAVTT